MTAPRTAGSPPEPRSLRHWFRDAVFWLLGRRMPPPTPAEMDRFMAFVARNLPRDD